MRTDDILNQIDTTLGDWDVGPDAMRHVPDGAAAIQNLPAIRIRVDPTTAQARLAQLREVQRTLHQMAEAVAPAAENAGKALAEFSRAFQRPVRAGARPAWQSPYGPAVRRQP